MTTEKPCLTLFFPMYNELKSVEPITRKALHVLSEVSDDFEILIVDDGSTDGSERIADDLALADPRVRVIHHTVNQGYGQALRTGFTNAQKDIVVYTDCDEPADLYLIADALPYLAEHQLVIGYRLNRWEGVRRYIYSLGYNALVRLLFAVNVHDVNFSFKLIRLESLRRLRLEAGSVFIDGEFLAEAVRHGMSIYQMPVEYQPRQHGESHFNSLRAVTSALSEIWAYWQRRSHPAPAAARKPVTG